MLCRQPCGMWLVLVTPLTAKTMWRNNPLGKDVPRCMSAQGVEMLFANRPSPLYIEPVMPFGASIVGYTLELKTVRRKTPLGKQWLGWACGDLLSSLTYTCLLRSWRCLLPLRHVASIVGAPLLQKRMTV